MQQNVNNMGKKYCDVGHKWCKLLQKGVCKAREVNIEEPIVKCPRIAAIETTTLYQLIREVKFDDVFDRLCYYFPDQKKSREGYENAFNELLKKNAEALHTATVEAARESERGIVDIETLTETNKKLITTMDEVLQIQKDGHEKRVAAEAELSRIEEELKQKLIEVSGVRPSAD